MTQAAEATPVPVGAFNALERLRGILAGYVVIAHARGHGWIGHSELLKRTDTLHYTVWENLWAKFNLLTKFSNEAVVAFFVLSGFSIAHSLRYQPSWGSFFSRRLVRLYPAKVGALLWAGLVFLLCVHWAPSLFTVEKPFRLERDFLTPGNVLLNLAYMPNGHLVNQFWSLPYEMFFYLLAPTLLKRWRLFAAVASTLWAAALFLPPAWVHRGFLSSFSFHYLILFALGTLSYKLYPRLHRAYANSRLISAIAFGSLVLGEVFLQAKYGDDAILTRDVLTGLGSIFLIYYFCEKQPHNRLLERLGTQSYSLYVTHLATIVATLVILVRVGFMELWEPRPYIWPLLLPLCFVIAEVNYRLFEAPSRNFLDKTRRA